MFDVEYGLFCAPNFIKNSTRQQKKKKDLRVAQSLTITSN